MTSFAIMALSIVSTLIRDKLCYILTIRRWWWWCDILAASYRRLRNLKWQTLADTVLLIFNSRYEWLRGVLQLSKRVGRSRVQSCLSIPSLQLFQSMVGQSNLR